MAAQNLSGDKGDPEAIRKQVNSPALNRPKNARHMMPIRSMRNSPPEDGALLDVK